MTTRIVLVGGFLGAGKTTLLLSAAQKLVERGYRVGLVTNDQGNDLIDTAIGNDAAIPVTEVAGGCFCCRFPDLLTNLQRLQEVVDPHLILAEPVGSCTDLVATVLRPLVQFYGEQYELAPLSVLLDSSRSIDDFSPEVHYLYRQQLAEAELLLLSKCDLLTAQERANQQVLHQTAFPEKRLLPLSAKHGEGVDQWLDIILGQRSANPDALDIDYDRYAAAEAALGWLNAKGQVRDDQPYSLQQWATTLLTHLSTLCNQYDTPIAHVKLAVKARNGSPDNVSKSDQSIQLKASLSHADTMISWDIVQENLAGAAHEFILNARINATPTQLEQMVMQAIEHAKPTPNSRYYLEHFECFRPLPPQPNYRL